MMTWERRKAHDLLPRQRLRWADGGDFVEVAQVEVDWVTVHLTVVDGWGMRDVDLPAVADVEVVVENSNAR